MRFSGLLPSGAMGLAMALSPFGIAPEHCAPGEMEMAHHGDEAPAMPSEKTIACHAACLRDDKHLPKRANGDGAA